MTMSLEAAAQAMREAMRETVKRHSLWYLIQGVLVVLGGVLALVYPIVSSVAVVLFLGWVLTISGVVQGHKSDRRSTRAAFLAPVDLRWCCRSSLACFSFGSLEKGFLPSRSC